MTTIRLDGDGESVLIRVDQIQAVKWDGDYKLEIFLISPSEWQIEIEFESVDDANNALEKIAKEIDLIRNIS